MSDNIIDFRQKQFDKIFSQEPRATIVISFYYVPGDGMGFRISGSGLPEDPSAITLLLEQVIAGLTHGTPRTTTTDE